MITHYSQVKLFEEENAVVKHSADIQKTGTKAFIITGKHSAKACGALADFIEALDNVPYVIFDEVEENPSTETIVKARDMGLSNGVDFVVGIGGGSPMDAAKAIALMIANPDISEEQLYDVNRVKAGFHILPIIAISTTCGTGSEVTGVSVLTNLKKQTKGSIPYKLFPNMAFVDGKYLQEAPFSVLGNTSVDALCHLVESYLNSKATEESKAVAELGLKEWAKTKEYLLLAKKGKLEAFQYQQMMYASTLAGKAIAITGTGIPHALSYVLTVEEHIPHGAACGFFLADYMQMGSTSNWKTRRLVKRVLKWTGFKNVEELRTFIDEVAEIKVSDATINLAIKTVEANAARLKSAPWKVEHICTYRGK